MTTTTKSIKTQLIEINKKAEQEKLQLILKHKLAKTTGIDIENIIVYSMGGCCFGWRKPLTKEQVKQITAKYPANGEKFKMTFASSEKNFDTDSTIVVKWENSHSYHHTKEFKIKYFSGSLEITLTVPESYFGSHVWHRQHKGKHLGFGRYEMFNDMFLDYFYTQSYSGGYNVLYFLEGAESLEEYENFCFTGEFKYSNEINN